MHKSFFVQNCSGDLGVGGLWGREEGFGRTGIAEGALFGIHHLN